ncbi:hypothetical protein ACS0TY_011643 [Phlomoides rotata]
MEDDKEGLQDGATAVSDEQQNQTGDSKEIQEVKNAEVDGGIEQNNGEISLQSSTPNPEHSEHVSSEVLQVEEINPPSVDANAICSEDDKCKQELSNEAPEVMSSAENGSREEELENGFRHLDDAQKEEETKGKVKEVEVLAQNTKEELNGISTETEVQRGNETEELKNEPDVKSSSRSFLLDVNDVTGDESGTEEDQAEFMKEIETFHKERCLDFKPPKFYQEPLNCLKLWRAVIRLGGYEQVTSLKLWRQVGESFRPPKTCTTVSWTFRGFYEKALLEYEKFKMRCGELPFTDSSLLDPASGNQVDLIHASGSGRARRDAAARAMQGWHSQRLLGNGEVGDPIIKDKNPLTTPKREKQLRNIGFLKRKGSSPVEHAVKVARLASKSPLEIMVVDVGVPADWVKVNVQRMKDCYEVYALVPGLLREEVRVQSDPAGRLVISGQPEQQDNPWGVTSFKKVVSLPTRIDPHQTSAVVTLHGQLFIRVPYEQPEA